MINSLKLCATVSWHFRIMFLFNVLFIIPINGQYLQCDTQRLQRCQQEVLSNTQETSGSGYSGLSNGWQPSDSNSIASRCSIVRQNLDCLLTLTPACSGRTTLQSGLSGSDVIHRARQYLDRSCDSGSGGGWKGSNCFQRSDVRQCENNFGTPSTIASSTNCRNYQTFRNCVVGIVRSACNTNDLQLMASYLMDKAQDLSWTCPTNTADYGSGRIDNYGNNNYQNPNQYGSQQQYGGPSGGQYGQQQYGQQQYGSRPDTGYSQHGNNQYGNQGNQYGSGYDNTRYTGTSTYGNQQQFGNQNYDVDRQHGGDTCIERASFFVRSCEDTLIQRQRDAREGRSGYDVQRRICCALFFYRDCISRVTVDRCRDPSPAVVDLLMGSRRRDLTVNCREYSRDQCSGAKELKGSFAVIMSLIMFFWFFKYQN